MYSEENELVVEALSHEEIDIVLQRLTMVEEKLESFCEVAPISLDKFKILKQFKQSKMFEFEPEWLSQLQIVKKGNEEGVIFYGKSVNNW